MSNWPKHQNPINDDRKATAPYNFVPLPDKVEAVDPDTIPGHDVYQPNLYTGHIEVKLTTASPLYVRCGWSPEDFDEYGKSSFDKLPEEMKQKVAQFFHTRNQNAPVIPGSSLRGMLRSMVEIVSYGKVQPVSDAQLVYRAVGDRTSLGEFYRTQVLGPDKSKTDMYYDYPSPNMYGGYLTKDQQGNWAIRPAQSHLGETFVHVDYSLASTITGGKYGRQRVYDVFVAPARRKKDNRGKRGPKTLFLDLALTDAIARSQTSPSMVAAKLIESGQMGKPGFKHGKHMHCAIFAPDLHKPLVQISDKIWAIYQDDRDKNRGIPTRPLSLGDPLFYLLDSKGDLIFFGPTMMFRLPYTQSPEDLGPKDLHQELNVTDVDFAEAMFGYVRDIKTKTLKEKAFAGRIFVGNACLAQPAADIWYQDEPVKPQILSGPKPTSFQLYLTQQEPNNNKGLDHYAPTSPHKTVIRGHKLYWHKGQNPAIENDKPDANTTQLTQIKPLKPGVSFTFTIRFENLSKIELGSLLWPLHLGGQDGYRLKLGMGKPLGMGAVKTESTLHLTNLPTRYRSLFNGNAWELGQTDDSAQIFAAAIDAFEEFIKNGHIDAFGGDGRIEQLKAMLNWPGPDANQTAYMTNLKEFRERKVLPTPVWVLQQSGSSGGRPKPPDTPPPPQKITYGKNSVVKVTLTGAWDKKIKGLAVKMPNGEEGHLTLPSRKQINQELGNTVELVVADFKNGVYILDFH